MKMRTGLKIACFAMMIAIVVPVYALAMEMQREKLDLSTQNVDNSENEMKFYMNDVYFMPGVVENDNQIPLRATLYLSNILESSSGQVKVIMYLIRTDTSYVENKSVADVGSIGGRKTKEIEFDTSVSTLSVSYNVDFLIFEDDWLTMRGDATIQARSVWVGGQNQVYWEVASMELNQGQ